MEDYEKLKLMVKNAPASIAEKRGVMNEHRESATKARSEVGALTMLVYRISIFFSNAYVVQI